MIKLQKKIYEFTDANGSVRALIDAGDTFSLHTSQASIRFSLEVLKELEPFLEEFKNRHNKVKENLDVNEENIGIL